jgi:K+-sensing histidine kinase KdpD
MPWVHQLNRVAIKRQGLLSWTVALAIFTGSAAVRVLFDPVLAGMKFMTFWPAIIVATLICGWRQGFFVLILSTVTAWYFFLEPLQSFAIKDKTTVGSLVGFFVIGGLLVLLMAALREAVRRAEVARRRYRKHYSRNSNIVSLTIFSWSWRCCDTLSEICGILWWQRKRSVPPKTALWRWRNCIGA